MSLSKEVAHFTNSQKNNMVPGFCFCWLFLSRLIIGVETSNMRDHLVISSFSIGLEHSPGWGTKSPRKKNWFSKSLPLTIVAVVHNRGNTKRESKSFVHRNSHQCVENEICCYGFPKKVSGFPRQHPNPVQNPVHSGQPFLQCLTLCFESCSFSAFLALLSLEREW